MLVNALYVPHLIGGAERFVQALAEGLVDADLEVVVVCAAPHRGVRKVTLSGVKICYVGLKNLYWPLGEKKNRGVLKPLAHAIDTYNPWMAREVARILDEERPDLVHTNNLSGFSVSIWPSVKQRRLPLIHTLHDHYLLCPRSIMFRRGANCERRCVECIPYALPRGRLSNRVDVVVGVSPYILERHLQFGYFGATPERKVIPNFYEAAQPSPIPEARPAPVRFGYLGMLLASKGLETLLESSAQLPGGTWSLSIAGRGLPEYERYLCSRYGSPAVRFLGHVSPDTFFPDIDVLVVPSLLRESFGRGVIEAYAHGVPVIGSDRGGIRQLIEEGRTGLLTNPDRPGDLTAKMRRFIDHPEIIEEMRPACREKAKGFLPDYIIEEYLGTYRKALVNT